MILFVSMSMAIDKSFAQSSDNILNSNGYVTDLDTAMSLSKDTKQNILLIFGAEWCGHCRSLKKDLPYLDHLDNKIICVINTDDNKKLARKFGVKSLPTSILLDNEFVERNKMTGYDKNSYSKWLESNHTNK